MEYKSENKICQNCKNDFIIEPEDFNFYEKIKVPPPTFCSECRRQRRMVWRNERLLYRRMCNLCQKNIVSFYDKNVPFPVYCKECWYGDKWNPEDYASDYDINRNFFEQYLEFSIKVPRVAVFQRNSINSDYSSFCGECKNVYLSCSVVKNSENVFYSKSIDRSRDIVDCLNVINDSEGLYENVEAQRNYNSQYLLLCRDCMDCYYSVDCINCSNCFLSYNLRNKKFCIRNEQYTEEDYFKELEKFNLKSRFSRDILNTEFKKVKEKAIYKFANINKCVDVTGNNLLNVKNGKDCFEIYDTENARYIYRAFNLKDSMDMDYGGWSEMMYEYSTGSKNDYNVKFSYCAFDSVRNAEYTEGCINCNNIFGCVSLRGKEYAIFNKVYLKEEFLKLREDIIKKLNENPYIDKAGRIYKYGEFFPVEFSPFGYNETLASEIFPLSKNEAEEKKFPWKKLEDKNFDITIYSENIPDNIDDVDDGFLDEVFGCAHGGTCNHLCNEAFRLTRYELSFYKKYNIPLPTFCPNCRHYERFKVMPDLKLWHRKCMKEGCENEFETSYAPDRPEIVYCEKCYQQEVY